jgi:DnaJ-class molecular chaperone
MRVSDCFFPTGFVQTIPNEGMPHHQYPSEAGSLFVEYTVVLPPVLTAEQKERE